MNRTPWNPVHSRRVKKWLFVGFVSRHFIEKAPILKWIVCFILFQVFSSVHFFGAPMEQTCVWDFGCIKHHLASIHFTCDMNRFESRGLPLRAFSTLWVCFFFLPEICCPKSFPFTVFTALRYEGSFVTSESASLIFPLSQFDHLSLLAKVMYGNSVWILLPDYCTKQSSIEASYIM